MSSSRKVSRERGHGHGNGDEYERGNARGSQNFLSQYKIHELEEILNGLQSIETQYLKHLPLRYQSPPPPPQVSPKAVQQTRSRSKSQSDQNNEETELETQPTQTQNDVVAPVVVIRQNRLPRIPFKPHNAPRELDTSPAMVSRPLIVPQVSEESTQEPPEPYLPPRIITKSRETITRDFMSIFLNDVWLKNRTWWKYSKLLRSNTNTHSEYSRGTGFSISIAQPSIEHNHFKLVYDEKTKQNSIVLRYLHALNDYLVIHIDRSTKRNAPTDLDTTTSIIGATSLYSSDGDLFKLANQKRYTLQSVIILDPENITHKIPQVRIGQNSWMTWNTDGKVTFSNDFNRQRVIYMFYSLNSSFTSQEVLTQQHDQQRYGFLLVLQALLHLSSDEIPSLEEIQKFSFPGLDITTSGREWSSFLNVMDEKHHISGSKPAWKWPTHPMANFLYQTLNLREWSQFLKHTISMGHQDTLVYLNGPEQQQLSSSTSLSSSKISARLLMRQGKDIQHQIVHHQVRYTLRALIYQCDPRQVDEPILESQTHHKIFIQGNSGEWLQNLTFGPGYHQVLQKLPTQILSNSKQDYYVGFYAPANEPHWILLNTIEWIYLVPQLGNDQDKTTLELAHYVNLACKITMRDFFKLPFDLTIPDESQGSKTFSKTSVYDVMQRLLSI
jgi:hypothetical protein